MIFTLMIRYLEFLNVKQVYDFYLNAKQIMKERGFKLGKWVSNPLELKNKIDRDENINCSCP